MPYPDRAGSRQERQVREDCPMHDGHARPRAAEALLRLWIVVHRVLGGARRGRCAKLLDLVHDARPHAVADVRIDLHTAIARSIAGWLQATAAKAGADGRDV